MVEYDLWPMHLSTALTLSVWVVALGEMVVSQRSEMDEAAFFFCDSTWDVDLIAM
jgi:hypothetical protein